MSNIVVRDDPDHERYVVEVDGELAGFTVYHIRAEGRYFFVHTEIFEKFKGKGVGTALVRDALDDLQSKGNRIVPICPFVWGFIQDNSAYQDLVDHEIFDRIADKLHAEGNG